MHNNQDRRTHKKKQNKTNQSKSLVLALLFLLNEQHT